MAMVDPEEFADKEVAMVYIAGRLGEGKRVEQLLSENAIDYFVNIELFRTYLLGILPTEYQGVGFYVLSGQAAFCRRALREAGLTEGLVEEDCD